MIEDLGYATITFLDPDNIEPIDGVRVYYSADERGYGRQLTVSVPPRGGDTLFFLSLDNQSSVRVRLALNNGTFPATKTRVCEGQFLIQSAGSDGATLLSQGGQEPAA